MPDDSGVEERFRIEHLHLQAVGTLGTDEILRWHVAVNIQRCRAPVDHRELSRSAAERNWAVAHVLSEVAAQIGPP
jgi:hypothetical protein